MVYRTALSGGNSGIGLETVKVLAENGVQVIMAARDTASGIAAADSLGLSLSDRVNIRVRELDLGALDSVQTFAATVRQELQELGTELDFLVLNAGIMALPELELNNWTNVEQQFAVNHLGHFLLTAELDGALKDMARVVTVASTAHKFGDFCFFPFHCLAVKCSPVQTLSAYYKAKEIPKSPLNDPNPNLPSAFSKNKYINETHLLTSLTPANAERWLEDPSYKQGGYTPWESYGRAKRANIHFARSLAEKRGIMTYDGATAETAETAETDAKAGIISVCLHPGVIRTPLWRR
jgi:NAD(P)-dependent dehydrogenase (short-subunit alcohol dehydrogenase family)